MESHSQTSLMKSHDQFHSEATVDLTLRLGFSKDYSQPDQPESQVTEENNFGLASGGGNGESEPNYNPNQILWSKELKTYVLKSRKDLGGRQSSFSYDHQVRGIASSANNNSVKLPSDLQKNECYTLLNPSSRRVVDDHEAEGRKRLPRRRASDKMCTNYNCNTHITPMWRSGPLGPKSLCNACGIRYRKDKLNPGSCGGRQDPCS